MSDRSERCGTCRFSVDECRHHTIFTLCKRRAPIAVPRESPFPARSEWPEVGPGDWCGEWQAAHTEASETFEPGDEIDIGFPPLNQGERLPRHVTLSRNGESTTYYRHTDDDEGGEPSSPTQCAEDDNPENQPDKYTQASMAMAGIWPDKSKATLGFGGQVWRKSRKPEVG